MGFWKKTAAVGMLAATVGGTYETLQIILNDQAPLILEPASSLPPEIPLGSTANETLICASNLPCDTANALGRLTSGVSVVATAVADTIKQATVAAEDQNFYEHDGMDGAAFARAGLRNVCAKVPKCPASWRPNKTEGGSTLTQMDVSWRFDTPKSPSYAQKLQEIRYALLLEKSLPGTKLEVKDAILVDLLDRMYYGRGAYGIESAARSYFGVGAQELTIEQAAILAGIPKAPSTMDLSPEPGSAGFNKELTRLANRYVYVVKQLKDSNYIDSDKMHSMLQQPPDYKGDLDIESIKTFIQASIVPYTEPRTQYFDNADAIGAHHAAKEALSQAAELLHKQPEDLISGYQIITTINTDKQTAMQAAIAAEPHTQGDLTAVGISLAKDGATEAMIGNKSWQTDQYDIPTQGRREVGSTFKPFAWARAIDYGWTPDKPFVIGQPGVIEPEVQNINGINTIVIGPGIIFPKANAGQDWNVNTGLGCHYVSEQTPCNMTLEQGLAASSNVMAAYIEKYFGLDVIGNTIRSFGAAIEKPYTPSLIIGSGGTTLYSLATAYNGLVANQGRATESYLVSKIIGPDGSVVYDRTTNPPKPGKQVVSVEAAQQTTRAMEQVIENGTAKGAFDQPAGTTAAKTGTSTDIKDVLTAAVQCDGPDKTNTAVFWIGDSKNATPMKKITSADAARLANDYFNRIPRDLNCQLAA